MANDNDAPPPYEPIDPEPVDMDTLAREELGTAWEQFKVRHMATAKAIESWIGDPTEFMLETLQNDAAYQALLADTEEELSVANTIRIISGVIFTVLEKVLMIL